MFLTETRFSANRTLSGASSYFLLGGLFLILKIFASNTLAGQEPSFFELSLEQLLEIKVSTASKKPEKLTEAPSIIEVVSAEDITRFGAVNLLDIFDRITSIQTYASSFAPNNIVSMRGQTFQHYSNHILFLLNGRPFRDSSTGAFPSTLYLNFPVNIIKRIEVIRGPGSVLYGSNAYSGVINIITHTADDIEKHNQLSLSLGSFDTREFRGRTGFSSNDLNIVAAIKALDTDGWNYKSTDANGVYDSFDRKEEDLGASITASYKAFSFNAFYGNSKQESVGATLKYPTHPFNQKSYLVDLGYRQDITDSWTIDYNLTHNRMTRNDAFPNRPRQEFSDLLGEMNISGNINDELSLMLGSSYENHRGFISQKRVNTYSYSYYSQLDYQVSNKLHLVGGLQFNKPAGVELDTSPRFAATYELYSGWSMKLLYGQAFRSPYFNETDIDAPSLLGNPNLLPEKIATTEIQLLHQTGRSYYAITLYRSQLTDLIIRAGSSPALHINSGELTFYGMELEAKYHFKRHWYLTASASYQSNEDEGGNNDTAIAPNVMAKFGISFLSSDKRFNASVFESYFGTSTRTSDIFSTVEVVNPKAEAYHLVTAKFSYDLSQSGLKNTSVSLFIDNLLDEDIYYPDINKRLVNSLPIHSGRAVYGRITTSF